MLALDSHQHFWHYSAADYPWLGAGMEHLRRDFLPNDLLPLLQAAGLSKCVAVQARQSLVETRWLLQLADQHDFIHGVVGWVDLRSADARQQLAQVAAHPKLIGVRHVVQDEPDDRFMLREDFLRGIALLPEFGLTYDILIYQQQLPAAIELARRFPEQPFVLDHIAKPRIAQQLLQPWADQIRELAGCPNVLCKVSGMVTEADWQTWKPDDFVPYLDVVSDAFGPTRLMYGSDWPVCLAAAPYAAVVDLARSYLSARFPAEINAIMGGNAAQFYCR